jgi:hypothetical protein
MIDEVCHFLQLLSDANTINDASSIEEDLRRKDIGLFIDSLLEIMISDPHKKTSKLCQTLLYGYSMHNPNFRDSDFLRSLWSKFAISLQIIWESFPSPPEETPLVSHILIQIGSLFELGNDIETVPYFLMTLLQTRPMFASFVI